MITRIVILMVFVVVQGVRGAGTNLIAAQEQRLGPGDKVSYRVIEDGDEPKSLTITDSGHLDVPYLGLVEAAGKSTQQLAKEVKGVLEKDLYYQATVVIGLELVNKTRVIGKVYVIGRVRNEGVFEIPAGETMTVSRAIVQAGGFSDFADKKNVKLMRKSAEGRTQTFVINTVEIREKGLLEKDLVLQPGDYVVVPESWLNY